jgi:hypothetical protein
MYNPDIVEETHEEREKEKERYEGLAKIALSRFPVLQKRENISNKEILNRLNTIQKTGYYVGEGYREMKKRGLWKLLGRIKTEIRTQANIYCPDVVREIDARNRAQIRERDPF